MAVGIEGDAKAVMRGLLELVQQGEPSPNQEWVAEVNDWSARRKERLEEEGRLDSRP